MRSQPPWYQVEQFLTQHFPTLRPAQRSGLALWVFGAVLARSACQSAVLAALLSYGSVHALRQRLREWLYDGVDRAAPCQVQLDVTTCFVPLLRWLLSLWHGTTLAFAIDATLHHDQVAALVISVLYRGAALPVAWHILPANRPGAWLPHFLRLLRLLRPVAPPSWTVLVLADRGLWSPRLWGRIRRLGWHPVLRVRQETTFAPAGQRRQPAVALVAGPGQAWVGRGVAFKHRGVRRAGTLCVVWGAGHAAPWVVLTDLAPHRVGVLWYGVRIWVELGFRALKGVGWQWQRTRRTDPARVARYWVVLAVASVWVVATGTRVEDGQAVGAPPARLQRAPTLQARRERWLSLFRQGMACLAEQFGRRRLWRRLWLVPEPWPTPPPSLQIHYHATP